MVQRPRAWWWSNYRATVGVTAVPEWLEVQWTLGQFASEVARARRFYREFVGEAAPSSPWSELVGQIYWSKERFRKVSLHTLREPVRPAASGRLLKVFVDRMSSRLGRLS